jgi:hypothetical protein
VTERLAHRSRRLSQIAVGLAAAVLVSVGARAVTGRAVDWTSWAVPVIVVLNAGPAAAGWDTRRPGLTRAVVVAGLGLALLVLAVTVRSLAGR